MKTIIVSSGEIQAGAQIGMDTLQLIESGGSAENTALVNGGRQTAAKGGAAIETLVNSQCRQTIRSGGRASGAQVYGRQIVEEGAREADGTLQYGGVQSVYGYAARDAVALGARQHVHSGGTAAKTQIAGWQILSQGAEALDNRLLFGGRQFVFSGARSIGAQIKSGGTMTLKDGGMADSAVVSAGGRQIVLAGATAGRSVASGGLLDVRGGGEAFMTSAASGGKIRLASGASAYKTAIYAGGSETVVAGGQSVAAGVKGRQSVLGESVSASVKKAGRQVVYSGGTAVSASVAGLLYLSAGGMASCTELLAGGSLKVHGSTFRTTVNGAFSIFADGFASRATVWNSGVMNVYGTVQKAAVYSGGVINVMAGALNAGKLTAHSGGKISVRADAEAYEVVVGKGASYLQASGAAANWLTVAGGSAWLKGGSLIGLSIFDKATVRGGTKDSAVVFAENGGLEAADSDMSRLHLDASGGSLFFTGSNAAGGLKLGSGTDLGIGLEGAKGGGGAVLSVRNGISGEADSYGVSVAPMQAMADYAMIDGLKQADGTKWRLSQSLGETVQELGVLKLNGKALVKNGVAYSLAGSDGQIGVSLRIHAAGVKESMLKASGGGEKLVGTNQSEIFYGSKGDDIFVGRNGRDCAVYGNEDWGRDVIKATNGTMTIVFNSLDCGVSMDYNENSGRMTIAKAGDPEQKIIVQGWNDSTHDIVYGTKMKAFNAWAAASFPTEKQTLAARQEVWKAAKLAS